MRAIIASLTGFWLITTSAAAGLAATATLRGPDGAVLGTAAFRAAPHGVVIEIDAKDLPPGAHAVLIHATSNCDPAEGFAAAGPVFSRDASRLHGYFAPGGPRTGDLPIQFAAADGTLHASLYVTTFTLGLGAKSLFDTDGASLVIHAASDDYRTQPEGRAGARIACGAILRTTPAPPKPLH